MTSEGRTSIEAFSPPVGTSQDVDIKLIDIARRVIEHDESGLGRG